MWKDPIVEEVRKIREEHAARFGFDLKAIYDDLKKTEKRSERKIVNLPPKRFKERQGEVASGGSLQHWGYFLDASTNLGDI